MPAKRVALDAQLIGNGFARRTCIQQILGLRHDRRRQYRRATPFAGDKESLYALLAVQFHRSLDADRRHAKCATDVRLLDVTVEIELRRDHVKRGNVRLAVRKQRHAAIEVGHRAGFAGKCQQVVDVRGAMRK